MSLLYLWSDYVDLKLHFEYMIWIYDVHAHMHTICTCMEYKWTNNVMHRTTGTWNGEGVLCQIVF